MSRLTMRRGLSLALLTVAVIVLASFALTGCTKTPMLVGTITNLSGVTITNSPFTVYLYNDPSDVIAAATFSGNAWGDDNNSIYITLDVTGYEDSYYIYVQIDDHSNVNGWYTGTGSDPAPADLLNGADCNITLHNNP